MAAISYCSSKAFPRNKERDNQSPVCYPRPSRKCMCTNPASLRKERLSWKTSWKPGGFLRWIEGKKRKLCCNERWLWRMCVCARSLRQEVEGRKFNIFKHWQITCICLMVWQHLLTGCINIRVIHHFYSIIALGNTRTLPINTHFCLPGELKNSFLQLLQQGST